MKKSFFLIVLALVGKCQYLSAQQVDDTKLYRIAVFAPLYLDSVFSKSKLKNEKLLPKFIMPSVEFVQGAQIALDSFDLKDQHVDAYIYDSKAFNETILSLDKNHVLDSINLIIGSVKDKDYKQLAELSLRKNIPFISATYPNDGGITQNPMVVIVNSTLKAHVEGIYSYLLENHGTDKIYLCRRHGAQEDKIASYLKMINEQEGKPFLNIQSLYFDSTISHAYFKSKLDSLSPTVLIGGSLDEDFASSLTDAAFVAFKKNYPLTLIGMPNWDGFKSLTRKDAYKDFPIHFTTPYYNSKSDKNYNFLSIEYMKRFKSKPTDMACKGFEIVQYFTSLMLHFPKDIMSHLNEKNYRVFSEYNFRPVYVKNKSGIADYIENKHLYVMKIVNGVITREW